jgi:tetratricopeptide (TPR) repeat protein
MGRLPEARTAYREALSLAPESQAIFKQALDLELLSGNFTNAFDLIVPRLEKQPDSPLVNFMAGYAHQFRAATRKPGTAPDAAPTAEAEADLRKAAGFYQRAIDLEPRFSDAYLALAALKARHESKQQALVVLQEMTTRNTNDANGFFQLASLQTELGNYAAARDAYEQSLALAPTNYIILNNLAYIYSEKVPDLDKALNYASEARQLARGQPSLPLLQESYNGLRANNSPSSEVEYHFGMALYMLGDEDEARARLQAAGASAGEFSGKREIPQRLELLNLNPDPADAATLARLETLWRADGKDPVLARKLGLVYERQGNIQKAKEVYEQALQRHDHNPRLLVQAAELYAGPLKDEARAAELAKRVRTLAPDNAAAARLLGRLALRTGDYRWARSLLEQSVQRYPDDPELPFDLAWADYSFGNTQSALDRARRSLQMPGFGRTNEALGFVAMVSATNAAQAKPLAADAADLLKRDPNYVPALMVMGMSKEADQRPAEAVPFFAQALTVFTNFAPAVRHLALAGFRQGNYSPTNYALITRANSAFPNDPELQKALGITAAERGEFARADQTLQRLVQGGGPPSEDAAVNFYLGKAKVNLRRASDARPFLEKALKSNHLPEALRREAKELLDKPAP